MESQSGNGGDVLTHARELVLAERLEPAIALLREHLRAYPDDGVAWRRRRLGGVINEYHRAA